MLLISRLTTVDHMYMYNIFLLVMHLVLLYKHLLFRGFTVFTINFSTYQPGGLVPMEFLQVPHIKTILSKV